MATSDAVPVIIGAAIGAGGAVIAQTVSAAFTARRERSRLEWDQDRQAREWKLRLAERFLSHKQELYSTFLSYADRYDDYILAMHARRPGDEENPFLGPEPELPDIEMFRKVYVNIDLIAPTHVSFAAGESLGLLVAATWLTEQTGAYSKKIRNAKQALERARDAMRADLRGDETLLESRAKELAVASKPTRQSWWRKLWPWKRGQLCTANKPCNVRNQTKER